MARIMLTEYDDALGKPIVIGWFDPAKSTRFDQGQRSDGRNLLGTVTGSQWVDESLYRTASGRWVLNIDRTKINYGPDTYRFLTDDEARDWLIRSEINDDALVEHFGDVPDESGPRPGRPAIGGQIKVSMAPDMLAQIDAAATTAGVTRSEWIRRACAAAL